MGRLSGLDRRPFLKRYRVSAFFGGSFLELANA